MTLAADPSVPSPETVIDVGSLGTVPRRGVVRSALRDPTVIATAAALLLIVFGCALAALISPYDPTRSSTLETLALPSAPHPLGTDGVGRDVLARLLHGGQSSLIGAAIAVIVALAIGGPLGLIAGYYRGWFDSLVGSVFNLVLSIPGIIVLLVVLAVFGNSIYLAMATFGLLLAPMVFRLTRASVVAVRGELYVDAARVAGLSDARILRRHILRVAVAPVIIQAAQLYGVGLIVQAGLEFLGLGSATRPSWGAMLNDAFANIYGAPILIVWPAAAIVLTVVLTSLLASAVRDQVQGRGRRTTRTLRSGKVVMPEPSATAPTPPKVKVTDEPGTLLSVAGLRVSYGERSVVSGVSFSVASGEVLGIVGETGSGKSQTAFSIMGLLPQQAVRAAEALRFDGQDLTRVSKAEMNALRGGRIGYIPQEPMSNLDPGFTVGSQLVEPIRRHLQVKDAEARGRALALLERVGIRDPARVMRSYPHELSGGMAQRVLIAGAVSCDPDLIIADEPTTALDVTVQAEVLNLLRSLQKERGMALIIVTHDLGVVADICDRVVVMRDGVILEEASVNALFSRPSHEYTRQLLQSTLVDAPMRKPLFG